jgi:tetratricopeptide (TPR) repeat protein
MVFGEYWPNPAIARSLPAGTKRRFEEAAAEFRRAAEMSDSVNVAGHPDTARSWTLYAESVLGRGSIEEAERALRSARDIYRAGIATRADSLDMANAMAAIETTLANIMFDTGRMDEGIASLRQASLTSSDTALLASVLRRLAELGH